MSSSFLSFSSIFIVGKGGGGGGSAVRTSLKSAKKQRLTQITDNTGPALFLPVAFVLSVHPIISRGSRGSFFYFDIFYSFLGAQVG